MTSPQGTPYPGDHPEGVHTLDTLLESGDLPAGDGTKMPLAQLLGHLAEAARWLVTRCVSPPEGTEVEPSSHTSVSGTDAPTDTYIHLPMAPLFARKEFLLREIDMTSIRSELADFYKTGELDNMSEAMVTTKILKPLAGILVSLLTGNSDIISNDLSRPQHMRSVREWDVESNVPKKEGGDTDIRVRKRDAQGNCVVKGLLEAKASRACGDGKAQKVVDLVKSEVGVRRLLGQLSRMRKVSTSESLVVMGLVWTPVHFIPIISRGNTIAIGKRATEVNGIWPDTLRKIEVWRSFVSVLVAWIIVMLVNDAKDEDKYKEMHPEQVEQAEAFLISAGEAIQYYETHWFALTRVWAALCEFFWQIGCDLRGLILTLTTPRRWMCLRVFEGLALTMDEDSNLWKLPIGLSLPEPSAIYETPTALTLVYAYPSIVVKVFNNYECFTRESRAYTTLRHLQGYDIPMVYGCGTCAEDERPFLILSNEGEKLPTLTDYDRAELEGLIREIHANGIHHHDLHVRNVLRGKDGWLKLIDFGAAEFDCRCEDGWKEDWDS